MDFDAATTHCDARFAGGRLSNIKEIKKIEPGRFAWASGWVASANLVRRRRSTHISAAPSERKNSMAPVLPLSNFQPAVAPKTGKFPFPAEGSTNKIVRDTLESAGMRKPRLTAVAEVAEIIPLDISASVVGFPCSK